MSDEPPLCVNCVHFVYHPGWSANCRRPLSEHRSLVTGAIIDRLSAPACRERLPATFFHRNRCGPAGRYFQEALTKYYTLPTPPETN